ncbi:MAG: hypothetical protein Q8922_09415 [Bacteroidota bacterium]|nr:hypothetical protein [Bacteroidota bacterium]MDP4234253.1 hypothetical protein [Bacteroidota bacterium]MDP4243443.1 hypothetical protein [Bacteroidota bacterium]MDP4288142.1 hypothetical protein [Bacteroidota bacterium]
MPLALPSRIRLILALVFLFVIGGALVFWYGRIGFLPSNQSIIFDGGWRILSGQIPFRDFTLPSGIVPSAMQAVFFDLCGISWSSYVLHAALLNGIFGIVAFAILRAFEVSRVWAVIYAALSTFYLFVPQGVPYMEQHSFFFGFVTLACYLRSERVSNANIRVVLLVTIPPLLLLGYLSKQIPAAFFALLIFADGLSRRKWQTLLWLTVGTVFSLLGLLILAFAYRIDWRLFYFYFFTLPGSLGFDRLLTLLSRRQFIAFGRDVLPLALPIIAVTGIAAWYFVKRTSAGRIPWTVALTFSLCILLAIASLAIWHVVTIAMIEVVLLNHFCKVRRNGLATPPRSQRIFFLQGLIVIGILFVAFTNMLPENGIPFVMICAGILHRIALTREGSYRPHPFLIAVFVLLVLADTAVFHVRLNMSRAALFLTSEEFQAQAPGQNTQGPLAAMYGPVYRGYRFSVQDLAELTDSLRRMDGAFWYFGDASVVYGAARKPSVDPALWYHHGVTLAQPGSAEFLNYERRLLQNFRRYAVRQIVIEDTLTKSGCRLSDFGLVNDYIARHSHVTSSISTFRVIELSVDKR